jgi:hypothetical protein
MKEFITLAFVLLTNRAGMASACISDYYEFGDEEEITAYFDTPGSGTTEQMLM